MSTRRITAILEYEYTHPTYLGEMMCRIHEVIKERIPGLAVTYMVDAPKQDKENAKKP